MCDLETSSMRWPRPMLCCCTANKKVICHKMEAKTLLYNIQSRATRTTSSDNLCSKLPTMYILIFWKVAICSLVDRYQRFSGTCHGSISSKYQYQSTKPQDTKFQKTSNLYSHCSKNIKSHKSTV